MQVTYLKSIEPIIIHKKPTKRMVNLANKMFDSEPVKMFKVLHSFSYPKLRKFDVNEFVGKNLTDVVDEEFPNLLKSFTKFPDCNLSKGEVSSLMDFTLLLSCFNTVIDFDKLPVVNTPDYQYIYGKKEIIEFMNNYPSEEVGILVFKFNTSKIKFDAWVNDSWKYIKGLNKKLPKNNLDKKLLGGSNLPKNFSKDLLIYLHRKNKSSYTKIADDLLEIYPNDSALMDVDQIKSRYNRIDKYFKNSKKTSDLMNTR